jgi:hypothetical protein
MHKISFCHLRGQIPGGYGPGAGAYGSSDLDPFGRNTRGGGLLYTIWDFRTLSISDKWPSFWAFSKNLVVKGLIAISNLGMTMDPSMFQPAMR